MSRTVARQVEKRAEAERALRILTDGDSHTERDLFPDYRKWHYSFLSRLVDKGVLTSLKEGERRFDQRIYQAVDPRAIENILDDQPALSHLIFPSIAPDPSIQLDDDPGEPESLSDDPETSSPGTSGPEPSGYSTEQLLSTLIRISMANAQGLKEVLDQLNQIEGRVNAMHDILKELM